MSVFALTIFFAALIVVIFSFDAVEDIVFDQGVVYAQAGAGFMGSVIVGVSNFVIDVILRLGYYGIFGLMFLESTSLPIPSEVILPFAGYLASLGKLDPWVVIALSTLAGILGSLVDYYLGRAAGNWERHRFLSRYSKRGSEALERANRWFEQYGSRAVFFTRMIPGFRTLISFPAGAARMKLSKFALWTGLGCFFWSALLVYSGLYLGSHWTALLGIIRYVGIAAVVTIGVIAIWVVLRWQNGARDSTQ